MNRLLNVIALVLALGAGLASIAGGVLAAMTSPSPIGAAPWTAEILLLFVVILPGVTYPAPDLFGILLLAAVTVIAVSSLVIRFRRSRGLERQQIKWLAYAAGITATLLLSQVVTVVGPATSVVEIPVAVVDLLWALTIAGFASFAPAAGIAILRYRLLAVAVSTLAVAALFQPFRRRMQRAVDRRFYRSRYDAQRTLEAFSARLRDGVDLIRPTDELREVVDGTVQPAGVSVWLREASRPS